jgi:16S rRNA G966 N2-methylase RsmD
MNCCQCEDIDQHFGEERVKEELSRYQRKGPGTTTRILLNGLREQNLRSSTLLDVGSGIGVIVHELLDHGITSATLVESSSAYLKAAEAEARSRGHHGRVEFVHGDFVQLADKLPKADLVTLDRVVCCYPYFEQLLAASADKSRKWCALSYPRDRWYVKTGNAFENWTRRRRADPFRTYIHPEHRINEIMLDAGFDRYFHRGTLTWQMTIYGRKDGDCDS